LEPSPRAQIPPCTTDHDRNGNLGQANDIDNKGWNHGDGIPGHNQETNLLVAGLSRDPQGLSPLSRLMFPKEDKTTCKIATLNDQAS
jgi:hypothetical protein